VKVSAGDALYLPSGVLTNPKPAEETKLLLALVSNTGKKPKSMIVTGHGLAANETVQWQDAGKDMTATKPEEIKKAPKDAARFSTKRYVFDGNSIRVATFKKGGRTGTVTTGRTDVLMYIAKGRLRRKEGDQVFEAVAGDAIREKLGNPGYWEPLEESVFIATDAPMNPASLTPSMVP
jgi:mannose-6-phosphate isomerase-like protein (cupin superfamily)